LKKESKMKNTIHVLVVMVMFASALLFKGGIAHAASAPFTCSSDLYQVISGQLAVLNPVSGAYTNIGSNAGFDYNAIGYDTLNNYIYGIISTGPNADDLVQIGSDGTTTDLGLPSGLPAYQYVNGDFDQAGNLYIVANSHTAIYKINIASMTTTTINITGSTITSGVDNVFISNNLYLLQSGTLSDINLNTDVDTNVTVTGPPNWLSLSGSFGAGWTDAAGDLYFYNNDSGDMYQIMNYTTSSPSATYEVTGPTVTSNDGANCSVASQNPFASPMVSNFNYTTPFDTALNESGSVLNGSTGNGLTVSTHTNPSHGSVTVNSNGTFLYTPTKGYSGEDSFTYTLADTFGRAATGIVTITVDPASPSTGFGTPNNFEPLIFGTVSAAVVSMSIGSYVLYRKRKDNVY
jgi:hypothetical protein